MKTLRFTLNALRFESGQSLVELMVAIGLLGILLPALYTGLLASTRGKAQQEQRSQAIVFLKEAQDAIRAVRGNGWATFAIDGTYHPSVSGTTWTLANGSETINGLTRQIVISDILRDANGNVVSSGGTIDPSTKLATTTISWTQPIAASIQVTEYLTRYFNNATHTDTTTTDFNAGVLSQTQVTNTAGGEVLLANNNKAKWCSPAFSTATIDLPDGPPVAVAATASATSTSIPNDVFTAVAPLDTTSTKLAYLNVTANVDPPVPTLRGTFTLDATKYSAGTYPSNLGGLTNSFKTNDVKYYKSASGKLYALLATDLPDHEVVVVQINNGISDAYQDPVNKIYKYWTFFNTRQYQGDNRSTPNQDQAPFGYGAVNLAILGTRGYVVSGGFLYTFDLSTIDSKTPTTGLDEVGCRIELDGYDCHPGNPASDVKYNAGQTGASWGNTGSPAHNDCSDGGNIELYADHQLAPVQVGANTYVYIAVGAGTNPELDIANVSSVPTAGSAPKISSSSCGTSASGNAGWKVISSLDFNSASGTEEAANSVFAKDDGTRAYMSSNGGIDANGDGKPDSDQFYVIDTSNKSSPKFLTGTSSTGAQSGYYNGTGSNLFLYPRRSLTVLNGQRAILVGTDGKPSDNNAALEYQVVDISTEASPSFCGGLDFNSGFNDLTSVSEADGDNFVYMVANTAQKQLKIIQGGPDYGIYIQSGTFTSGIIDLGVQSAVNRFSATVNQPTNTTIQLQMAVVPPDNNGTCTNAAYTYVGPDGTGSTYFTPSGSTISGTIPTSTAGSYQNPARCVRYKATLSTTDQNLTPTLYDLTFNYSP